MLNYVCFTNDADIKIFYFRVVVFSYLIFLKWKSKILFHRKKNLCDICFIVFIHMCCDYHKQKKIIKTPLTSRVPFIQLLLFETLDRYRYAPTVVFFTKHLLAS